MKLSRATLFSLMAFMLTGCLFRSSPVASSEDDCEGAGQCAAFFTADLFAIMSYVCSIGGPVLLILSFVPALAFLAAFRHYLALAIPAGICCMVIASVFEWVGEHWVLVLCGTIVAMLVSIGVYVWIKNRKMVRRVLEKWHPRYKNNLVDNQDNIDTEVITKGQ